MHVAVPPDLVPLLDDLEAIAGVRAVVLGGFQLSGTVDDGSDWDLGVYYQGPLDSRPPRAVGTVRSPWLLGPHHERRRVAHARRAQG